MRFRARDPNERPRSSDITGPLVGAGLAGGVTLFVEPEAVLFGVHTIGFGHATSVLWVFAKAGAL